MSLAMNPNLWGRGRGSGASVISGSSAQGLLATSVTVRTPPGALAGDRLVAAMQGSSLVGVIPPVGWAVQAGPTNGASIASIAYDGVTPSYIFTSLSAVDQAVVIVAVRGFSVGVVGGFGPDAVNPTPNAALIPVNNSLNLSVVASDAGQSYSMPAGWTAQATINAGRTVTVFQRDERVPSGNLAGVQINRTSGAANGRAAQIGLTAL